MESERREAYLSSPLLQISQVEEDVSNSKQIEGQKGNIKNDITEELKRQLWLAGPLISANLLLYLMQVISVMFVGHLGELALSGASMATSFASVTGFSLMVGMSSALDTLCGQSHGAKQHHMLGIHMQRAMVVLLLVSIPVAIVWANTGPILIALGQDVEISEAAGLYARYLIPTIFAQALFQCLMRFLRSQSIVLQIMLFSGTITLLHLFVCWVLILKLNMGYRGAAVAISISYWMNVIMLALYIRFSSSCKKSWPGFSKEAFRNIVAFIRLAVPSAIMVCFEIWSFELMVLLSGFLPNPKLQTSVLSICLNTTAIVWMIPSGLSSTVSTRVSNELGAGNSQAARLAAYVVLLIMMVEGIVVFTVTILIRNVWGYAYSNEVAVVKSVAEMMPIIATSNIIDGIQGVLSGTARGCGWQKIGAFINLGSYYLLGIPSSILLAFVFHLGGKGLWLGIIIALSVQGLCFLILTIFTDWEKEANKAKERVFNSMVVVDTVQRE